MHLLKQFFSFLNFCRQQILSKSNMRAQYKILTQTPWFISNKILHDDYIIKFIDSIIKLTGVQQLLKLEDHIYSIVI